MKTAFIVLLVLLFAVNTSLWLRLRAVEEQLAAPHDFPLGETMGYLQRYLDKIWYAGQAGNWDLAHYYHDEMAETADDIMRAGVAKDGVAVSKVLGTMLPPALDGLDQAVAARDPARFRESYTTVVNTCNGCHQDAKRPFIHLAIPAGPPSYWNQQFGAP